MNKKRRKKTENCKGVQIDRRTKKWQQNKYILCHNNRGNYNLNMHI